jgi:hypothetical protein
VWNPPPAPRSLLPAERFWNGMRAGLRYAHASPPLKATLVRAVSFLFFAGAYWALLPLIARERLHGTAQLYGVLVACIGAGALSGALFLPRVRALVGPDRFVALGTFGTAIAIAIFAFARAPLAAVAGSLLAGVSWVGVLTSLNVSAQVALPDWVRARGLSVYNAVFFGSMALGSLLWGRVAGDIGISPALLIAAGGALLAVPLTSRFHLQTGALLDLSPSAHWPQALLSGNVGQERGPVITTIEYRIDPARLAEFLTAVRELRLARVRHGALAWGVYQDAAQPDRVLEYFLDESWLDYLRHYERVTHADLTAEAAVFSYHVGTARPQVTHYIAATSRTHRYVDGRV